MIHPTPEPIDDIAASHLRQIMIIHADYPSENMCIHCEVSNCQEYRTARARLIMAGRLPIDDSICAGHEHGTPAADDD